MEVHERQVSVIVKAARSEAVEKFVVLSPPPLEGFVVAAEAPVYVRVHGYRVSLAILLDVFGRLLVDESSVVEERFGSAKVQIEHEALEARRLKPPFHDAHEFR